jgi:hypothetical protein
MIKIEHACFSYNYILAIFSFLVSPMVEFCRSKLTFGNKYILTIPLFMYPVFILEVSTRLRFTQPRSTENYAMSSFHSCILFYSGLISCSKIVVVFWSKYVITVAPNDYFE